MSINSLEQMPEGEKLRQVVKHELARNSLLKDENIMVTVEGDEVILDGDVDSLDKKWLAEDITGDIFGVLHVRNQINVFTKLDHFQGKYGEDFYENP